MKKLAEIIVRLAERGDSLAMAVDGPCPPTHECLSEEEQIQFYRAAYVLAQRVIRDGR